MPRLRAILALALAAAASLPAPAAGQSDCDAAVRALFQGGALDPFTQPNRREVTRIVGLDGRTHFTSVTLYDGPVNRLHCADGACYLRVGTAVYEGPEEDGPWVRVETLDGDPEGAARQRRDDIGAAIGATECLGEVDIGLGPAIGYRFHLSPDPTGEMRWVGGDHVVLVDAGGAVIARLIENPQSADGGVAGDYRIEIEISAEPTLRLEAPG